MAGSVCIGNSPGMRLQAFYPRLPPGKRADLPQSAKIAPAKKKAETSSALSPTGR